MQPIEFRNFFKDYTADTDQGGVNYVCANLSMLQLRNLLNDELKPMEKTYNKVSEAFKSLMQMHSRLPEDAPQLEKDIMEDCCRYHNKWYRDLHDVIKSSYDFVDYFDITTGRKIVDVDKIKALEEALQGQNKGGDISERKEE